MVAIEWLKFQVSPQRREEFIQKDAEIWTSFLAKSPAFLSKEVWIDPVETTQVIMVIRWSDRQEWKSIPQDVLDATEQRFAQQMGDCYEMVESKEYQLRKFPLLKD